VKGQAQSIEFPPVTDLRPGATVTLSAKASSGLPVHYEVEYGPVVAQHGKLVVSELPAKPQFPYDCRVTAHQIGRRIAPAIQSAPSVSIAFQVVQR
jgi:hypothetical protein